MGGIYARLPTHSNPAPVSNCRSAVRDFFYLIIGICLKKIEVYFFKTKSVADFKDFKLANAKKVLVFLLVLFYLIKVGSKIHKQGVGYARF